MQNKISHTLVFRQSPADVWEYLTNPDLMELWLMKNNFQLAVGHDFQFFARPIPQMEFDGNIYCRVLEIDPQKKLVYSWKGGPGDGVMTLDSVVTWTLSATEKGTELHLEHTGFTEKTNVMMITAMDAGWIGNMRKIVDFLNKKEDATTNA